MFPEKPRSVNPGGQVIPNEFAACMKKKGKEAERGERKRPYIGGGKSAAKESGASLALLCKRRWERDRAGAGYQE